MSSLVPEWLSGLRLEQYCPAFREAGLRTLWECRELNAAQLERMGVALPGHRKRILGSLQKLFPSERGMEGDMEREKDGEEEERPVPMERTKFRPPVTVSESLVHLSQTGKLRNQSQNVASNLGTQDKAPPPIPPRQTPNRPPIPFTPTSVTVATTVAPVSMSASCPVSPTRTDVHVAKPVLAPATQTRPMPTPRPRPESLPLKETVLKQDKKPSPISPSVSSSSSTSSSSSSSEQFHLYEQCSSPGQAEKGIPPLPPKSYSIGTPKEAKVAPPGRPLCRPPIPPRGSTTSSTTAPPKSPPAVSSSPADDLSDADRAPHVPPRPRSHQEGPKKRVPLPPSQSRLVDSSDSSDEYEDLHMDKCGNGDPLDMADKSSFLLVPGQSKPRYNSLCSDDELLEDEGDLGYEPVPDKRDLWIEDYSSLPSSQNSICLPITGQVLARPPKADSAPQLTPVIKMGWLDKNPPQGSLIYQRRWVKLDADYLRYFDNEKDIYSKRIIPTSSITGVANVGDQKFEVVTHNRTFLFRAESDSERNEWVSVLQDMTGPARTRVSRELTLNPLVTCEMKGYLELRGLRSKLYTVVCGDKVFLYKNAEDYKLGIGITSIDMNVGNVKDMDRRAFDLTTPYRIFSFVAETDQLKDQWMEAMRNSIAEALSNYEVAEKIWGEPANQKCADCDATKPEWAAINLCVVFCKRCAGEHRGLGPSISKVRSLKMDKKVWTDDLIQLFLLVGNDRANHFWAANVPPSEALSACSSSEERRRFITAKYREGKYRRYHALFGNQKELDNALCINVQSNDVCETLALVFCGADVNCDTGNPDLSSPAALAMHHGQNLQVEFLTQNRNTEIPRSEVKIAVHAEHYMAPPSITHNGFLFKTASMARPITERKNKEEFSRRWCVLNDGNFNYYESDKIATPNGGLKMREIVCLAVSPPETHGYDHSFEIYSDAERLYLFGTDNPETMREWVKSIAKSFIPACAEDLLQKDFERIGRLRYKDPLNLESSKVGWFCLVASTLHVCLEDGHGQETIHLQKLLELSRDNEVLVLVERGRTLYIEGERKLDFYGWASAIERAAGSSGDTLSQQQLTEADIPVIVERCIHYITQYGLTSEGIYRKSGVNSKIAALLEAFRRDARSVWLKEGEQQVDDVSNVLKRFFRDIEEGLFSQQAHNWLSTTAVSDESRRISQYQLLFNNLPRVNKATLRTLVNHLYCVQRFSEMNQMNLHNLAIVFGPTLFQTDGKDYNAGRVVEDLIQHYITIFHVNEQQLKTQLDEITYIIKLRDNLNPKTGPASGDFICTVYLEEKKETAEQHVKIPAAMTAAELTFEILDRRKITVKEKDYWCCFEVNEKEEIERPLHYQERVLPILHSLGTDSHLLVKKNYSMEAMLVYLASKVDVTKHGMLKFREEKSLLGLTTGSFNDRYFMLNQTSFRLYKDVRSNRAEKEWPVKCLKVYQGIKKKLRPPTCWGLTVAYGSDKTEKQEKQQWYLCCDTQTEMREWFATFLSIQHAGLLWPAEWVKSRAASRSAPLDTRLGNVSLIPLRGTENEMRNSVAAFTADPLSLLGNL
ncbi:arf-GAP with Rho-GAP domain, ANK repeat and PH domain-containing protein 1 isoform X1 [Pygocentrus nattereri]|uniref:ArfGAP with RhoGAP domain, ankyrin repeat and PH domain 1 n=2 Tax=Pygocentrus nattereri TaxID=42514 RepID=A0AAR2K7P1_PYGNA|nr:arf-GAP with Rho-GAP domain, ANK repeat and PH domain-containing protein 1 isoform X1 [Pygocentrus nattereri]XP_037402516.1 arf-GAP with Rho-GAP domain, ANK repeat and PH domain-containing protein 1 isoform X1 [Pygocentrus nattereri]XP_037402517.1 arf-GAP with Rho-GAP domain, ANK repeat and PH domain-containing protein 1 isoform X1 [Pygocentrus nattereri]XP_037402518.1 arf-GAP with Rho-GAP domain, ANK repeat and PH domain-containing protein 1 isoform X1 [Pygocentrus nattereri]